MNIYFTLDYELFLGEKTGTPENCLVRPMEELCKLADNYHFKFVVFVDAAYLLRMKQIKGHYLEVEREYDIVSNHVRSLAKRGHDVQLHFHPQWIYSEWDKMNNEWKMDRGHYKLSDLDLFVAKQSLSEAKELLDNLIGYKTTAFRAGGFCLDDFDTFSNVFKDLGLIIDSSVARGLHVKSSIHYYDYRKIPEKQIYRFDNSIKKEDDKGDYIEMSISSAKWSSLHFLLNIKNKRDRYAPKIIYGDGKGISDGKNIALNRLKQLFKQKVMLASIDGSQSNLMDDVFEKVVRKGYQEVIFIGHPNFVTDISLLNIHNFMQRHNECNVLTTKNL